MLHRFVIIEQLNKYLIILSKNIIYKKKKILTKSSDSTIVKINERVLSLFFCGQPEQPFESVNTIFGIWRRLRPNITLLLTCSRWPFNNCGFDDNVTLPLLICCGIVKTDER